MTDPHHSLSPTELLLADSGFDVIEYRLLAISRYFLVSYTKPQTAAWEIAFDLSCVDFGERDGPHVAMALVNLLRAMRESRKTTFHFNNPRCPQCAGRVCDCERHLIGAIKAARHRKIADVRMESLILCEGFDTEPLIMAINSLVALLPPLKPATVSARTVPAVKRLQ